MNVEGNELEAKGPAHRVHKHSAQRKKTQPSPRFKRRGVSPRAWVAGADGVHVGQTDLPAAAVRAMLGPAALLGVSVKTPQQAADAAAAGADYVGAGAVFPTGTKADASVIGLDGLRAVCAASSEGARVAFPSTRRRFGAAGLFLPPKALSHCGGGTGVRGQGEA